jgi:hypothetical protein
MEMEEHPKAETAVERWRAVTADVLRPVPFTPRAAAAPSPAQPPNEKPNFAAVLKRGKWVILSVTVLGALFVVYSVIKQVPLYGASTTLELMSPTMDCRIRISSISRIFRRNCVSLWDPPFRGVPRNGSPWNHRLSFPQAVEV